MVKRKDLGDVPMGGTQPEGDDSDEVRLARSHWISSIANRTDDDRILTWSM